MIKLPLPSWRGQCVTIPSPLTRSCPVISFNFSEFFLRTRQTLHYRHDDDTKCNERFKNSHNFFVRVFWNVMYLICFTTPQPFALAGDDIVGVCKETTLLVRSVYFFFFFFSCVLCGSVSPAEGCSGAARASTNRYDLFSWQTCSRLKPSTQRMCQDKTRSSVSVAPNDTMCCLCTNPASRLSLSDFLRFCFPFRILRSETVFKDKKKRKL